MANPRLWLLDVTDTYLTLWMSSFLLECINYQSPYPIKPVHHLKIMACKQQKVFFNEGICSCKSIFLNLKIDNAISNNTRLLNCYFGCNPKSEWIFLLIWEPSIIKIVSRFSIRSNMKEHLHACREEEI